MFFTIGEALMIWFILACLIVPFLWAAFIISKRSEDDADLDGF